jgi:hypothetical protein
MKQEDTYKILAVFLVITMLGSVIAYFFIGKDDNSNSNTDVTQNTNLNTYNPDFWTLSQPFNSISDALNMTPPGVKEAYFVDLDSLTLQMIQMVRMDPNLGGLIQQMDSRLYKSNTTKLYYAGIEDGKNGTFLLLSTMFPSKNDFDYIVLPNTSNILQRQDTGAINIMGTPVIYAPTEKVASDVLEIMYSLNRSVTAYDQFGNLLEEVDPAPYQIVNANVSFAKQFYIGINLVNGSYERTTAYLNANSSVMTKINRLKANSTERGFEQYNINRTGNHTIVKIVAPELSQVLNEETN